MTALQSDIRMTHHETTSHAADAGTGTVRPAKAGAIGREQDSMADLAAAAAKGDRKAFESIHRRLGPSIHKMLLERAGGRADVADDLSQRTWLAAWESLRKGRYDPERSAITTFVYAISYKMWLQFLRTASRPERLVPDVFDAAGIDEATPEYEVEAAELLTAVRQCLRNLGDDSVLTDEERGIIRASAAGASDRDIAKQLKIAASTLNARKHGAIEKIRRFLAGIGHRSDLPERRPSSRE